MSPSRSCQVLHTSGVRRGGAALCQRFRRGPSGGGGASSGGAEEERWALVLSHFFDAGSVAVMLLHVLTKVMLGELQIDTYSQTFQDT